ncbi:hypothetical protein GCM10027063_08480 [Promicromonospora xylanilytica]
MTSILGALNEVGGSSVADNSWIRRQFAAVIAALALTGAMFTPAAIAVEPGDADAASVAGSERVELSSAAETWTAVRSGAPDDADGFAFEGERFVGQCVGEGGIGCAADDVQRVAFDFGDLGSADALADLQDGVIRSAHLTLDVVQDQECGVQNVVVHPASAVTDASTWNTTSLYRWLTADLASAPCGADQDVRVDVTSHVKLMVRDGRPVAFGLKVADEDCRGCGRASFGPAAALDVVLDMTDTVSEPWTHSSSVPCVTGADRPALRVLEPALSALLSNEREPSPSSMSALFTVRDLVTGEQVRQVETPAKASGTRHTVTVGPDRLAHGGSYSWSAQAILPSGALSEGVTCEFSVDVEAPGEVTIAPIDGYPAAYEHGAVAGGPFVPGAFSLSADGDVTSFRYEFSPGERGEITQGEMLEFVPERSGFTRLNVRAVDGAGNVSAAEPYEFYVGFPDTVGRWLFNEGTGSTAAGELDGPSLGLSGDDLWGPGAFGDFDPADFGLALGDSGDTATSVGQLVDPTGIVTVSALVKPSDVGPGRIVAQGTDFELVAVTDPECPTTSGTCWAFTAATGSGTDRTTVYADAEPVPGVWNTVTAIRNPHVGDVRMYFCRSDSADRPRQVAQAAVEPLDVASGGHLVVGGSDWTGTVDNLRVLAGAPDEGTIEQWCFGSTGP